MCYVMWFPARDYDLKFPLTLLIILKDILIEWLLVIKTIKLAV